MNKKLDLFKNISLWPVVIYSFVLILLPLLYILFLSFCETDYVGGINYHFSIVNYLTIIDSTYLLIFAKSALIGIITTLICLVIAYPFAIFLMDKKEEVRNALIKLVMIPFLTNSLIRTYGWIVLLRKNGIINNGLTSLNIIKEPLSLMYNNIGIIIGMVYTLLPFMILPVYAAVNKLDPNLIKAAKDLGANKFHVFKDIIFKETISGAFNGSLMVFIPAIGYFFISDILGGGKQMIIGNLIKDQFLTARNWPFGSAISIFLIIVTFLLVRVYKKIGGNIDELGGM
ncbi:MAG: ABC transporter permease [Bacilli bacterium]|nr:ABC transporter permease [Bacilli bacterium]